ncbi:alpha beta-hydrolase [Coniophora puteana RWD-64-598 SS2]|uniref:Alpha beta-hydrolase n=1 Tax=Coniophora puteana (strain RWD-64-598) TaxID=741705 RepID=A0A5M3MWT3_CONPW|nr:alpha beta-hydrolase [Coniophora puteana RWD-64-598 SS2]EIW83602.1 alpha beta-hydrolase [Coniophora puteana RWD-64-598 SS2]
MSSVSKVEPVDLAYDEYLPPNGRKERPLVILHGFFGSKRNWQSLSKAFMKDLGRPVYTLDLRNHGSSPHVRPMTYTHMATDILRFCSEHSLENISLMGHSMGGKVAMAVALSPSLPPALIQHLIVSDIAPVRAQASEDTRQRIRHIEGMQRIQGMGLKSRKEAEEALKEYESDPGVRAFLLTNLDTSEPHNIKFKVPLNFLKEGRPDIETFPWAPGERTYEGSTLFVKGRKSKFINHKNIPTIKAYFPNAQIEELDTGHWVHAERPTEYKKLIIDFIGR